MEASYQTAGLSSTIFMLVVALFFIVTFWKIYVKAGLPGWGVLIPIYNTILFLKMAGKPWWWIFLLFIPIVGFIVAIIAIIAFAHNFGKSTGFGIGLLFLGLIFYPILAFGKAEYKPVTS